MPQTIQLLTTISFWISPPISEETLRKNWYKEQRGTPEKGMKIVFSSTPPNSTLQEEPPDICSSTLYYSDKKDAVLHCCSMQHHNWFSWISSSDERWTTPIKDQPNFWTIQLYGNIVAHCEKIVFVFVFDPLVVLNVIRAICWFILIDCLDAAKHHEIRNYLISQAMTDLEMCIVTKLWHHLVV